MNAFESLVAMLHRREGFWTTTEFKVELTKAEKRMIGKHSSPRWEIDLLAYKGSTNELRVIECKSFLDSPGVTFRNGGFEPPLCYKLFSDEILRSTVLGRLKKQLVASGACASNPKLTLCLAAGKIAKRSDRDALLSLFKTRKWLLLDRDWICNRLHHASDCGYENDVAFVVSKLLLKSGFQPASCLLK